MAHVTKRYFVFLKKKNVLMKIFKKKKIESDCNLTIYHVPGRHSACTRISPFTHHTS